uniref:Uncharacterized protein n=1 Tax=Mycobacterium riyadhense TaxID=486698 RepID=A0A653ER19_9MYCO|nr:hypothetical protein BIN_B_02945 [Mycobacterium riyadhense]
MPKLAVPRLPRPTLKSPAFPKPTLLAPTLPNPALNVDPPATWLWKKPARLVPMLYAPETLAGVPIPVFSRPDTVSPRFARPDCMLP